MFNKNESQIKISPKHIQEYWKTFLSNIVPEIFVRIINQDKYLNWKEEVKLYIIYRYYLVY